jgi:drug/metabolite transporter (DMT)-like permease
MSGRHVALLFLLSAIWGGAFSLIRNAVPALGPIGLSAIRLVVAAVLMLGYLRATGDRVHWRRDWRAIAVIGIFGAALPFPLFSFGATRLSAGVLAIINATVPLWGAVIARVWLGDRMSLVAMLGIVLGIGGVAALMGGSTVPPDAASRWAFAAGLGASLCFAVAGVATKALGASAPAAALGAGVLVVGAAFNVPLAVVFPPNEVTVFALVNAVALAVLASALATVLYLRLIQEVGPTRSMTVTFLIPVWGIFWSALLLGEPITRTMIAACAVILAGTALVVLGQRAAVASAEV